MVLMFKLASHVGVHCGGKLHGKCPVRRRAAILYIHTYIRAHMNMFGAALAGCTPHVRSQLRMQIIYARIESNAERAHKTSAHQVVHFKFLMVGDEHIV
jgi:hypothetical protein